MVIEADIPVVANPAGGRKMVFPRMELLIDIKRLLRPQNR